MSSKVDGRFEFHTDNRSDYWWTKYEGSTVIAKSSEGYRNKSDCQDNARRFGYEGKWWGADDVWTKTKDRAGQYRWNRKASNGETVGAAHKGWSTQSARDENMRKNGWG